MQSTPLQTSSIVSAPQARKTVFPGAGFVDAFSAKAAAQKFKVYSGIDTNRSTPCHRSVLAQLQQAIPRNEMFLAFQPKIELKSGRCIGAETLLRWTNATLGDVSPSSFIAIAENSGLIGFIGDWTLCKAVSTLKQNQGMALTGRLAINVSAHQLANPRFVEHVITALSTSGVDGSAIEIEVTESALLADTRMAAEQLNQLRERGITIALDDFGTGYATLALLKQLPIDVLKIPPEFVSDIATNESSARLVEAVINMAHLLGLRVVAEGIESESQACQLIDYGCDFGQGYLFSKALTKNDFIRWVKSQEEAMRALDRARSVQ